MGDEALELAHAVAPQCALCFGDGKCRSIKCVPRTAHPCEACGGTGLRGAFKTLNAIRAALTAAEQRGRLAGLREAVDTLPRCQSCDRPATREDCNCLLLCDDDEHGCLADGGPEDLPWAGVVRKLIEETETP